MKVDIKPIQLSNTSSESRVVKTCALFTFRALRAAAGYASKLPAVASQAATDIATAWDESRPNVR